MDKNTVGSDFNGVTNCPVKAISIWRDSTAFSPVARFAVVTSAQGVL